MANDNVTINNIFNCGMANTGNRGMTKAEYARKEEAARNILKSMKKLKSFELKKEAETEWEKEEARRAFLKEGYKNKVLKSKTLIREAHSLVKAEEEKAKAKEKKTNEVQTDNK